MQTDITKLTPYVMLSLSSLHSTIIKAQAQARDAGYIVWPGAYAEVAQKKVYIERRNAMPLAMRFAAQLKDVADRISLESQFGHWHWSGAARLHRPFMMCLSTMMHPCAFMLYAGLCVPPVKGVSTMNLCGVPRCVNPRHNKYIGHTPQAGALIGGANLPHTMPDLAHRARYAWPFERMWTLTDSEIWEHCGPDDWWQQKLEFEAWTGEPVQQPEQVARAWMPEETVAQRGPTLEPKNDTDKIAALGAAGLIFHKPATAEDTLLPVPEHQEFEGGTLPTLEDLSRE